MSKQISSSFIKYSTILAFFFTLMISLGLPTLFFSFLYQKEISSMDAELEVTAGLLSSFIQEMPEQWINNKEVLSYVLSVREHLIPDDNAYIQLPDGSQYPVYKVPGLHGPFLRRQCPLTTADGIAGVLILERSLYLPIKNSMIGFVISATLGFGLFFLLRALARHIIGRMEQELQKLAFYDPLTSLPNRRLLDDRIEQNIQRAERESCQIAILFLNLDNLKSINDSYGFHIGDQILKQIAVRLENCLRRTDTVARHGTDDFVVVLSQLPRDHETYISLVANKIISKLSKPLHIGELIVFTSCVIGIAVYPNDGADHRTLLKHADLAKGKAKNKGRNTFHFFSMELNRKANQRMHLETCLRQAQGLKQHFLTYQPKFDLKTKQLSGIEALVRWQHPELGLIPPTKFIPLAEETGLIQTLGRWVLQQACHQHILWQQAGLAPPPVSVNLSPLQLRCPKVADQIRQDLKELSFPPELLELELTESGLMENKDHVINTLTALKKIGIKIAIDDFGTGYSSLEYLKHFPVDRLKIDRCFVSDIEKDSCDKNISQAIIGIANSLNLKVTAEGVETEDQLNILAKLGCDEVQGYLFSHPLSADQMADFMAEQQQQVRLANEKTA